MGGCILILCEQDRLASRCKCIWGILSWTTLLRNISTILQFSSLGMCSKMPCTFPDSVAVHSPVYILQTLFATTSFSSPNTHICLIYLFVQNMDRRNRNTDSRKKKINSLNMSRCIPGQQNTFSCNRRITFARVKSLTSTHHPASPADNLGTQNIISAPLWRQCGPNLFFVPH